MSIEIIVFNSNWKLKSKTYYSYFFNDVLLEHIQHMRWECRQDV